MKLRCRSNQPVPASTEHAEYDSRIKPHRVALLVLLFGLVSCSDDTPTTTTGTSEPAEDLEQIHDDSIPHGFTTFPNLEISIGGLFDEAGVEDANQTQLATKIATDAFNKQCAALGIPRSSERFYKGRGLYLTLYFSKPVNIEGSPQVRAFSCKLAVIELAVLTRGDKNYRALVPSHSHSGVVGLSNPQVFATVIARAVESQTNTLWNKANQAELIFVE